MEEMMKIGSRMRSFLIVFVDAPKIQLNRT